MHRFAEFVVPSRLGGSFRWLLASSWVTNLGDGITLAAGPLLVASQTHNPLAVAMATFLQRLPWLLLGLYAGVVADRLNRRAIVIATGLARVAILLLLTASILTHRVDIAVVLAALFLFGVNETFGDTTTTTLLPMLVDKPDLGIANSRALTGVVVWNQLAGPPVGAALFAAGMALPFVSESVCVLAGVLLISRVRVPRPARLRAGLPATPHRRAEHRTSLNTGCAVRLGAGRDSNIRQLTDVSRCNLQQHFLCNRHRALRVITLSSQLGAMHRTCTQTRWAAAMTVSDTDEELMTRRQVAYLFRETSAAVAKWAQRGLLPEVHNGAGRPRYRRADVEELLRSGFRRRAR